jgi:ribose 5-phosphate isomerase A
MTQDELKAQVARAALDHVVDGGWVGVGTGSTVNHFIDALATVAHRIRGAVSSSEASTARLRGHGIPVAPAESVTGLPVYVDGADEIDPRGCMIKGGGAALTREKIVADLAARFVCIVDESKQVPVLGRFPLPVEVIAMAAPQLARRFAAIGGQATLREGVQSDNGHPILDVRGLQIDDPLAMEAELNQWPGVVTVGIFARQRASVCLVGTARGVRTLTY